MEGSGYQATVSDVSSCSFDILAEKNKEKHPNVEITHEYSPVNHDCRRELPRLPYDLTKSDMTSNIRNNALASRWSLPLR